MKIINIGEPINAGKSTISKLLVANLPNALFIEVDI
jgi:deoxyadenosine/deoxycytidine kinase